MLMPLLPLTASDRRELRNSFEVFIAKQNDRIKNGGYGVIRPTAHYSGPAMGPAAHPEGRF